MQSNRATVRQPVHLARAVRKRGMVGRPRQPAAELQHRAVSRREAVAAAPTTKKQVSATIVITRVKNVSIPAGSTKTGCQLRL
jgi:hypothetical protein